MFSRQPKYSAMFFKPILFVKIIIRYNSHVLYRPLSKQRTVKYRMRILIEIYSIYQSNAISPAFWDTTLKNIWICCFRVTCINRHVYRSPNQPSDAHSQLNICWLLCKVWACDECPQVTGFGFNFGVNLIRARLMRRP